MYSSSCLVSDHIASFRTLLQNALEMGAFLVNCHSGHDSWNVEKGLNYFQQALAIEKELVHENELFKHVLVVHETHRQRLLYSPYQTLELLSLPELKELKVNADLSHWVFNDLYSKFDITQKFHSRFVFANMYSTRPILVTRGGAELFKC